MEKIQTICLRSKTHVAWRDIQQALSPNDRKKWNKETCIESIVKLEYMNYGELLEVRRQALFDIKQLNLINVDC